MIAAVAERTGTITSETHCEAASSLGDLAVQKIDVIVDNDNGIVHDDPEDHYERCDRDLMQREAYGVHCPKSYEYTYWDSESRDHGHPDGQQNYCYEHH